MKFYILIIFLLLNSFFSTLYSKEILKKGTLNITSENVEIIRDENKIIFLGTVEARKEDLFLYADKMIVNYKNNTQNKIDIKSIKAEKNVKFQTKNIIATGDNGLFNVFSNILILENNIKATENGITVFAQKVEYDITTGKSKIFGNQKENERVIIILDNKK